MGVTTTQTNKPFNPRGNDQSPKGFNRAKLFSGKALDFDGVNDRLDGGSIDALGTGDFSYSVYFNPDGFSSYHGLFAIGTIYNFGLLTHQTTGQVYAYSTTTGDINSGYFLKDGEWQHITFVKSGTSHKFYINGKLFSDITDTEFSVSAGNYKIGQITSYFANGQYSNARLFNTALTAEQVADLYNNPEKVVPTGVDNTALKLWLPMMEGAGTTAYDGSGNGNHGTISGATYVNGIGAPVSQSAVINWNKGTNLFAYSEQLDNSYWTKVAVSVIANNIEAPNGEATAEKALEATSTAYRDFVYRSISVTSGQPYTLSAYVKNGLGRDNAYFFTSDGNKIAKFNIATGAYIGNASGNGYNAWNSYGITDAGNGWYRIHATLNSSAGGNIRFHLGFAENTDDVVAPYAGNNSKGLYAWGMQLENASSVGPYVRTGATAQTSEVLLPQGLTTGRDITGVNLFENVRKQGALNLDGNSWAEVHDNASLDLTTAVTLEAWVYWDGSVTSAKGLLGRWFAGGACYMFFTNNATQVSFYINTSSSTFTISGTGWKHIVGTYDSIKRRVYVDGQEIGSGTAYTTAIATSSDPVEIGRYNGNTAYQYDGDIAQPRIYNRALTAEEVQRSYDSGKNIFTNS